MIKLKLVKLISSCLLILLLVQLAPCQENVIIKDNKFAKEQNVEQIEKVNSMKYRGVVYDVGLQFNPGSYSVEPFNPELVKHDMLVIANELHANAVRIEGEDILRLISATEAAHSAGLKIFFNPWKMGANAEETILYMTEAAIAAEKLRMQGIELVFIAGCEYSIFNKDVFQGETLNERLKFLITNAESSEMITANKKLNEILTEISKVLRNHFNGTVTYASGTWEFVDWDLFDVIGIDYYRNGEPEQQYIDGLQRYKNSKPIFVMEVGSCTYEGAAARGAGGYTVLQGTNPDGTGIYEGGKIPIRSEKEQADYIETQINILKSTGIEGVFIYVFSFPIMPFSREEGKDMDMTSYSLVKSYPKQDTRSQMIPNWEPKEAFQRLAEVNGKMAKEK